MPRRPEASDHFQPSLPGLDWTEGQFQAWVVRAAKDAGWRVHVTLKRIRKASIVADPDWPDLEMVRGGRLVYAELKASNGRLSDGQRGVMALLAEAVDEVYLWTPAQAQDILATLASSTAPDSTTGTPPRDLSAGTRHVQPGAVPEPNA